MWIQYKYVINPCILAIGNHQLSVVSYKGFLVTIYLPLEYSKVGEIVTDRLLTGNC